MHAFLCADCFLHSYTVLQLSLWMVSPAAGGSFHLSCAMEACSLPDMSQPNRCKSPLRLPSQVTLVYVKLTVQMNQRQH